MSSSPPLPISNTQPATIGANPGQSQPSKTAVSSLRALLTRFSGSVRHALSNRRPWTELIDRTAFTKPDSLADATSRVRRNYSYFRVNYLTLIAIVLMISLLWHPYSLLILVTLLAAWLFLYSFRPSDQPLVIFGRAFSDRETLGFLIVLIVVVIFLTSAGSVLVSAALIGVALVCVHGAFRVPEDLFLDDQEQIGSGLFSFVGGAASSAVAAAGPAVISRV
ncbi:hypothetical protein HS088_TW02G00337 [Tripterygium wilfordii]|uniref:PRA1 family protein n=2 Tax=Tripterygium wilfordii TaxID=458696 RepID=A0A7J7DYQ8_TRIWF|nr:hypothetical protein HS088_TW02G00337 [Tripterygium wilfordii]